MCKSDMMHFVVVLILLLRPQLQVTTTRMGSIVVMVVRQYSRIRISAGRMWSCCAIEYYSCGGWESHAGLVVIEGSWCMWRSGNIEERDVEIIG